MTPAIRIDQLSKKFVIQSARYRHDTLRDQLVDSLKSLWNPPVSRRGGKETVWALQDVSAEIPRGQVVGMIGRNGAGKSTLLKVLSRITYPTGGRAELFGRVASLLEVGIGFDRELTGRENIYLSAAILGMTKGEIARKFDEIVAFAEVERFLDTPVKRYSSGMYLRLAFAVAAHLDSEILLLDEVLAVGDAAFQKRCLGKMESVARDGRTVLFVSHNMAAITHFCNRCMWLEGGRLVAFDNTEVVVNRYLAAGVQHEGSVRFDAADAVRPGSDYIRPVALRTRNNDGEVTPSLDIRFPFSVEVEYQILRRALNLRVGIELVGRDGTVLLSSTDTDGLEVPPTREPGTYIARCSVPGDFLNHGQYFVSVGSDSPMIETHFRIDRALTFHVEQTGGTGGHVPDARAGMLRLRLPWNIQHLAS